MKNLNAKGLASAYISGDQDDKEAIQEVIKCHFKVIFFSPEVLLLKKKW